MYNAGGPNMSKVIQGLNDTPDANSRTEAMSHNGQIITDIKSKANALINHYARVSIRNISESYCNTNRQFRNRIKVPSAEDESCALLLMSKLQSAIKKIKGQEAAALAIFNLHFSSHSVQKLLSMFSSSLSLAHCPRIWRVATIIPLLKAGKSPSEVASICPINLTSCVVKLLERILADCLYYIAETNNMFSRFQTGFRKGWSLKIRLTE